MVDDRLGETGVSGSGTDSGSTAGRVGVTGALTVTSVTSRSWTVLRRLWRLAVDRMELDLVNSGSCGRFDIELAGEIGVGNSSTDSKFVELALRRRLCVETDRADLWRLDPESERSCPDDASSLVAEEGSG